MVPDMAYRQALSWQEKAERAQASGSADDARSAWINAGDWWRKFAERSSLAPATISTKLDPIQRRWKVGDVDTSLGLGDQLARDLHYAGLARCYQARAGANLDKAAGAKTILENLEADLAAVQKSAELTQGLAACLEQSRGLPSPNAAIRLQGLMTDLVGDTGAIHWLRSRTKLALKGL